MHWAVWVLIVLGALVILSFIAVMMAHQSLKQRRLKAMPRRKPCNCQRTRLGGL